MARASATAVRGAEELGSLVEPGWPSWADPDAIQQLRETVRSGRIGHAYLLSGPKGVGKLALARAFAQALCCTSDERAEPSIPCGHCRACRNVVRNAHPDVEVVDLEAQAVLAEKPATRATLSIDTVRRMRTSAALLPLEAARRLVIVDDTETMAEPAQQALLKTLEEPPPSVTLMLLADEPESLLPTVRSRCLSVPVRPRSEAHVKDALLALGVDHGVAADIAALSRGCPAWAILAAAQGEQAEARRSERERAISWVNSAAYDRLVTAYVLGGEFGKRRSDVIGVVQAAIQVLRARMIASALGGGAGEPQEPTMPASGSALRLSAAITASLQCLDDLETNVRPRLALEAMVLKWPK